eukprot:5593617-Pyramimonas_sp.AAC.1
MPMSTLSKSTQHTDSALPRSRRSHNEGRREYLVGAGAREPRHSRKVVGAGASLLEAQVSLRRSKASLLEAQ